MPKIMGDGTYASEIFQKSVETILGACIEVVKRSYQHYFAVIPVRWIVGRSFAVPGKRASFGKTASALSAPACR